MSHRVFPSIHGAPVVADTAWLPVGALLVWSLAEVVMPWLAPELGPPLYWYMAGAAVLGILVCLWLRELVRVPLARRAGLPVRTVTLSPLGGIVETEGPPSPARAEALATAAGLVASIGLAALCVCLFIVVTNVGAPVAVLGVIMALAGANALIALCGLLPAYPLDGGRVLRAVIARWSGGGTAPTRRAAQAGAGLGASIAAAGGMLALTANPLGGGWIAVAGLVVIVAALRARPATA